MDDETKMIAKTYNSFTFKNWFTKNIKKITFALALTGAITGSLGLILGSVSVSRTNELNYYLNPDGTAVWGNSTIWWNKWNSPNETDLYFSWEKRHSEDVKWDGSYTPDYFKH